MLQLLKGLNEHIEDYQSIPFWSWNDKLEEDELVRQIEWMKANGIGGFFMHARGGLRTPYMSEEWMRCVDTCVEAAKARGMQAWVYDENGWPSGFAGGKLLEKEENRDAHLTHTVGAYDPAAWLSYSLRDRHLRRVTEETEDECLNLYLHISPSTADILNGDVVDQFLQETHEKYAERYGAELSRNLRGFFTDEPQYYRWGTPYTRVMPEAFRRQYGEELFDSLGLLFVEKEGYRTFRYRYWCTMQHLMLNSYSKKIYDWCNAHGVRFTGHYVEEQSLDGQMSCCAGVMPFYEYMHMPGIDWLNRHVGNELSLRQIASAARQMGKEQVISESYGCCGWDVTPAELKKIGEFQYVGGVNRTCQHLVPYAEHGQRKRDYPSHFSGINPWIGGYFKEFNDYFTRLGYLLAHAEESVSIAMLHPIRSAYFDYKDFGDRGGAGMRKLERALQDHMRQLSQDQIPFHFLDETLLEQHGFVRGDRIGCGQCEYEYLLLPTCYTMGLHTERLIRQFVENGGKVLLLGEKPTYREGEPYEYTYLRSNVSYEQLKATLPYRLEEPVPGVHATLRRSERGEFLYVQNYGDEERTVRYRLKGENRAFERWDLATMSGRIVAPDVTLQPGESCILFFSRRSAAPVRQSRTLCLSPEAEVVGCTENYLTLDTVRYAKDGVTYSEELPCMGVFQKLLEERYDGPLYLKYTFHVTAIPPWLRVIAEEDDPACLQVNGCAAALNETWSREHEYRQSDITRFVHLGRNEIIRKCHFHQSESIYYALFGEGVTESLLNCMSYDTEIEPLYLAGPFGVFAKELRPGQRPGILLGSDFTIGVQPKTVRELVPDGFPFFSGTICLRRTVTLEQTDVALLFEGRFQAVKVWINGKNAGRLLFDRRLDISPFTRVGENEILLELTVSNRNFMGPHHTRADEEPESVGPYTFELPGTWKEGESPEYRASYAFVPVPIR